MTTPKYEPSRIPNDPDAEQCYSCGAWITPEDAFRCQGADPDQCCHLLCSGCRQDCECGLPVCPKHQIRRDGLTLCANCAQDVEVTPQPEAERLVMLAEAGCTVAEVAALSREVGRA